MPILIYKYLRFTQMKTKKKIFEELIQENFILQVSGCATTFKMTK